jgi:hypothetical protein
MSVRALSVRARNLPSARRLQQPAEVLHFGSPVALLIHAELDTLTTDTVEPCFITSPYLLAEFSLLGIVDAFVKMVDKPGSLLAGAWTACNKADRDSSGQAIHVHSRTIVSLVDIFLR